MLHIMCCLFRIISQQHIQKSLKAYANKSSDARVEQLDRLNLNFNKPSVKSPVGGLSKTSVTQWSVAAFSAVECLYWVFGCVRLREVFSVVESLCWVFGCVRVREVFSVVECLYWVFGCVRVREVFSAVECLCWVFGCVWVREAFSALVSLLSIWRCESQRGLVLCY